MCRRKRLFFPNEEGFTLMEVIVSLVILSLLSVVVWQGFINAGKLIGKTTDYSLNTIQVLQLDQYLRKRIAEVTPPFWLGSIDVENEPGILKIPYYKGERGTFLIFGFKDSYLTVDIQESDQDQPDQTKSFGPFSDAQFELALDQQDLAYGIQFDITQLKGPEDPLQVITRFRSNPYLLKD